ncbi:homoserine dehydrogenase [Candidatus Sororendozoicomonas aggregata]|uniref:homoserine dehydrogenase n=1 Tax=Candidatus Sororendozoicomonas aggregata TaxID=3073239 RepID=UPI002ED41C42
MKPVKVGICGLGTVGSGTFNVLNRNQDIIAARVGHPVIIEQVAVRHDNHACDTSGTMVTRDIFDITRNPDIDIVVELIGGYETAKELILSAIEQGKHVVTANKALIAEHGNEIFKAAKKHNVLVAYEAAVAGGIPIIKCLREGLAANRIHSLAGIINGTGNYILTEMGDKQRPFSDVLKEAQTLGYAESDPTFDIEGIDACHKLTIMASIAFGIPLQFNQAYTEGISLITPLDIQYAEELGYRIKHLGIARRQEKGIEIRVHPALIPASKPMANINGVLNAIVVNSDALGQTLYTGPGAGSEATASSVIADIMDIARTTQSPEAAVPALGHIDEVPRFSEPVVPIEQIKTRYYLRIHAENHPDRMNAMTDILSTYGINVTAISQKSVANKEQYADIVIETGRFNEAVINRAIDSIESLTGVQAPVTRIRIETTDSE